MKNKKHNYFWDILATITIFTSFAFFNPVYVLIFTYLFIIIYLFVTKRNKQLQTFFLAIILGTIWNIIAKGQYSYNSLFGNFFGLSVYPFLAWPAGLFASYILFSHLEKNKLKKNFIKKFLLFSIFYILLLLLVETVAYHIFDIKNIANAQYVGLPICNCLHAPIWMKISYLLLGPIYYIILKILKK